MQKVSVAFDVAYDRILHQDIELENSISEVTLSFFFFFFTFFFSFYVKFKILYIISLDKVVDLEKLVNFGKLNQ